MEKIENKENDFMKVVVNTITTSRLLGSVALPFVYKEYGPEVAALCTLGLYTSDMADGALARKFNVSTLLGSLLDATSDKLLNFITFTLLALNYPVMWAPIILEMAIMVTNYTTYKKGGNAKTSKIGKIKTIVLAILTIIAFIIIALPALNINSLEEVKPYIINIIGYVIASGSLITLLDYIKKYNSAQSLGYKPNYKNNLTRKTFKEFWKDFTSNEYYRKHNEEPILRQLYK